MSAFTLTTRTVNEADVFDTQLRRRRAAPAVSSHGTGYNVHLGASGSYVFRLRDLGSSAAPPRHCIRFATARKFASTAHVLIDNGRSTRRMPRARGRVRRQLAASIYTGEHFWFDIGGATRRAARPDFAGYYTAGHWLLTGENRRYTPSRVRSRIRVPRQRSGGDGGVGAWELAARYSNMIWISRKA